MNFKQDVIQKKTKQKPTFNSKILVNFDGGHFDNILAFEKSRMDVGFFGQTFPVDDHFIFGIHFVATLEQHVKFRRICDKYSVIGVVRFDPQQHGTSQYRIARIAKSLISINTLLLLDTNFS